mmetsp:Transcript_21942/g.47911  ORF Transcript_21942/g.47911 Transcript_21942/m.47911 type:complete len:212 (-) Transcript_21942:151-786(-)
MSHILPTSPFSVSLAGSLLALFALAFSFHVPPAPPFSFHSSASHFSLLVFFLHFSLHHPSPPFPFTRSLPLLLPLRHPLPLPFLLPLLPLCRTLSLSFCLFLFSLFVISHSSYFFPFCLRLMCPLPLFLPHFWSFPSLVPPSSLPYSVSPTFLFLLPMFPCALTPSFSFEIHLPAFPPSPFSSLLFLSHYCARRTDSSLDQLTTLLLSRFQ